jgi:ATP-dependent Clp protease ATP-binding subunit ClpA
VQTTSTKCRRFGFSQGEGEKDKKDYEDVKNRVMDSLKEFFRPEFLNRVDDIVVFDILSQEAIQKIVEIQVDQSKNDWQQKKLILKSMQEVCRISCKRRIQSTVRCSTIEALDSK